MWGGQGRGLVDAQFDKSKWYRVSLRVNPHRITVWIDGQQRFEFDTTPHEEDGRGGDDTLKPLAVFTWQGEGAIRALRLRRLKAEAAQATATPDAEEWTSLFDGKTLAGWQVPNFGVFAKHGDVKAENGELLFLLQYVHRPCLSRAEAVY
jgi:hypothetical protein